MATTTIPATLKLTANEFVKRLKSYQTDADKEKVQRYFKSNGKAGSGDTFMGVRMGQVFLVGKEFIEMPLQEIEKLLVNPIHEVRAGAVSIMDWQARRKKTPDERRKELYDLYLMQHAGINNWDLVDRGAMYVIGGYLFDKKRDALYKLAKSKNIWERRTAIVSTGYFIRQCDLDDTFKIAEALLKDSEDLIHKATGWMLRFAGDKDKKRLVLFLEQHGATMPRTMLRYAIEKFDKKERERFLGLKKAG